MKQLAPVIEKKLPDIKDLIFSVSELELVQRRFYQKLIDIRFEKILKPAYTKLMEDEMISFKKGRSR